MSRFIGLDLGTTTLSAVLLDLQGGQVQQVARRRNDSGVASRYITRAEQNPQRILSLAVDLLGEVGAVSGPVDGIGITGQMHGLLAVDGNNRPLTPLISWQDRRTAEPLAAGSQSPGAFPGTALDLIAERLAGARWQENGCRITHGYGAATLFWLRQRGELPQATVRVCTLPDWIAGRLTGRLPVTDPSLAASWGVYSLAAGGWNLSFLHRLGLEAGLFPAVRLAGKPLGGLVLEVADQTGLPAGLPVSNALGDTQASFLGSVSEPERTVLLNLGTGGQVCWLTTEREDPGESVETRPLPGGERTLRVGASLCAGAAYAWLNRTVRAWLDEFGVEAAEETVYRRLDELAEKCEEPGALRVRTSFLGMRGDPEAGTGAIEGLGLESLSLGCLARATLAGIVDELYGLYRAHVGDPKRYRELVAAGGMVWQNRLLPQLIAERFRLPVKVIPEQETGAIGAATVAGWAHKR